jgi:hypothetical protein
VSHPISPIYLHLIVCPSRVLPATVAVVMGVFFRYRLHFLHDGFTAPTYARYSEYRPHQCSYGRSSEGACCSRFGDVSVLFQGATCTACYLRCLSDVVVMIYL